MNSKIIFAVFIFLLISLVSPAIAVPATKTPVTATSVRISAVSGEKWQTNGDIIQVRGNAATYSVTLNIFGQDPLEGISTNILDGTVNMKTGEAVFQYSVTWTFDGGSFEGRMQSQLESYPPPYETYEIHCVLKGSGEFKGQMLHLFYEGTTTDPVWNGYLINPMN